MLPSPTAAATRLTGLKRTSPAAKMPGTLVSSRYGSRSSSQARGRSHVGAREHVAARVDARSPAGSQAVSASAPMKMKRPPHSRRRRLAGPRDRGPRSPRASLAVHGRDLGADSDGDVGLAAHLVDEVLRHALLERVAAAHDRDGARVAGEEERGLTGRVARADDADVEPVRVGRLAARRAVVDALADQRSMPGIARCRQVTPVATMIVRPRSSSPSSRCDGCGRAGSMPVISA